MLSWRQAKYEETSSGCFNSVAENISNRGAAGGGGIKDAFYCLAYGFKGLLRAAVNSSTRLLYLLFNNSTFDA